MELTRPRKSRKCEGVFSQSLLGSDKQSLNAIAQLATLPNGRMVARKRDSGAPREPRQDEQSACSAEGLDEADEDALWDALTDNLIHRAGRREYPKTNLSAKERREFRRRIAQSAISSWRFRGSYEIPTILLPVEYFVRICKLYRRPASVPKAELVCEWLKYLGFNADRTRANLHGYPGLFRELSNPPPWVDVQPEDCDGPVSRVRAKELRPLYKQITGHTDLVKRFRLNMEQRDREMELFYEIGGRSRSDLPRDAVAQVSEFVINDFQNLINLGQLLGAGQFEKLFEAVFDFDEFDPANGTPDLFVWDTDDDAPTWFFAEVKGPRDHLGPNQYRWIGENWELIKGRIVLLSIGEDKHGTLPSVPRKEKPKTQNDATRMES